MTVAPMPSEIGSRDLAVADDVLKALIAETESAGGALYSTYGVLAVLSVKIHAAKGQTIAAPPPRSEDFVMSAGYRLTLIEPQRSPLATTLQMAASALRAAGDLSTLQARMATLESQTVATLEINRAICNVPDLDQLLTLVSERCRELLNCEVAGFALLEEHAKTIVWRAMSGCRTETYRRVTFPEHGGVAGRAISGGEPVIVPDFLADPSVTADEFPISFAEGLRSVLGVPLQIHKRPRGCLMIGHRQVHNFTSEEIDALISFSSQAAIAVENAELYDHIRREQARLESVVQSINEGLILIDLDGRLIYVNRQAENFFGLSASEWLDTTCDAFFERVAQRAAKPLETKKALAGLADSPAEFPALDVVFDKPPSLDLRLTHFNVYESSGKRLGSGYLCRDVAFEKHVDAMKSEVISLVSHEIRTPLAAIRGYASALIDDSRQRARTLELEYLQTIDMESARLDDLVRNLTDVSKLDAGVLFLDMHDISPSHLLRQLMARWRKSQRQRRFRVSCDERIPPIEIDRHRVAQVLDNLLSNAVKYSAVDAVIEVTVTEKPDTIIFSVADRGVGIPRAKAARVFDRFYRVAADRNQADGSGLGLYISRGIVEAHGGRIWLESRSGEGTTVHFSLPKRNVRMG